MSDFLCNILILFQEYTYTLLPAFNGKTIACFRIIRERNILYLFNVLAPKVYITKRNRSSIKYNQIDRLINLTSYLNNNHDPSRDHCYCTDSLAASLGVEHKWEPCLLSRVILGPQALELRDTSTRQKQLPASFPQCTTIHLCARENHTNCLTYENKPFQNNPSNCHLSLTVFANCAQIWLQSFPKHLIYCRRRKEVPETLAE